jgi:hypothetical protein
MKVAVHVGKDNKILKQPSWIYKKREKRAKDRVEERRERLKMKYLNIYLK